MDGTGTSEKIQSIRKFKQTNKKLQTLKLAIASRKRIYRSTDIHRILLSDLLISIDRERGESLSGDDGGWVAAYHSHLAKGSNVKRVFKRQVHVMSTRVVLVLQY